MTPAELRLLIREVPDYPKPGILFKDITTLIGDPRALGAVIDAMVAPWVGEGITHVIAVESRGFLFGGAIAARLGAGLVPVRKPGKLPYHRSREDYALEYGTDALEMHTDAVGPGSAVIVVDDVLATGGTAGATVRLVERHGARVVGCGFLIELGFLGGRQALGTRVECVIGY